MSDATKKGDHSLKSKGNCPINVLFVNDHLGFSDGVIHGPARYFLNILACFDPTTVKVRLCILRPWHPFAEELEALGIEVVFLSRSKWNLWVLIDLLRVVRKYNIHILHLAGMKGCLLGRIVSRLTGIRAVIHLRDMNPVGSGVRMLQKALVPWTDAALAVSGPIRTFGIDEFAIPPDRIKVLHNPIGENIFLDSTEICKKIKRELNISPESQVIAIIGRLSPEKGHKHILNILPKILSVCPKVLLLVVGSGSTLEDCKDLVLELGIEKHVCFTGYRKDIQELLMAIDLVVLPSEREGLPNAALEAIAAGRPVVAFSVGGLPEIVIDGKTGFLCDSGDLNRFSELIVKILKDKTNVTFMKEECLKHSKQFSISEHIQRLEQLYQNLSTCHGANKTHSEV